MEIFYTNKLIFWNNEASDFMETDLFENYFQPKDWIKVNTNKSINWDSHYNANFYASDNFEATYFKIVKNNKDYYFFISDIVFDGANGKQYSLTMDLFNTYTREVIKTLKQENPNVFFKRKMENRYFKLLNGTKVVNYKKQQYLFNIPKYLSEMTNKIPYEEITDVIIAKSTTKDTTKWYKGIIPSGFNGHEYDGNYYQGGYLYARVQIPQKFDSTFNNKKVRISPIMYIPISIPDTDIFGNSYSDIVTLPDDRLLDIVNLPVPPSYFKLFGSIKDVFNPNSNVDLYNGNGWGCFVELQSYLDIPFNSFYNYFNNETTMLVDDTYNIDTYKNEMLLINKEFFKITINGSFEMDLSLLMYNPKDSNILGYKKLEDVRIKNIKCFPYGICSFSLSTPENGYDLYYQEQIVFDVNYKIPIVSSSFSSFIANNSNSMETSINLANEEKTIRDQNANRTLVGNQIGGALSVFGGVLGAVFSGGKTGIDSALGGVSDMVNSGINYTNTLALNEFSYKKTVSTIEATKRDMANRPGSLKDPYSKGCVIENGNFVFNMFSISEIDKVKVFSDIYFNGYVLETYKPFNTYDNRINFNYFELGNCFPIISQYVKLPKEILKNISKQLETGVRLWKTNRFDYTLKTDNREISYEIK